jgi:hypothetical protein
MERKEGKVSDTPTPRTDGEWNRLAGLGHPEFERRLSHFARELERELTEARDQIDDLTATGIHSCSSECKRPNCVLKRELTEVTKQRDALAKVARDIRAGYGGQVVDADCPCEDCELLGKLDSALATLEGKGE